MSKMSLFENVSSPFPAVPTPHCGYLTESMTFRLLVQFFDRHTSTRLSFAPFLSVHRSVLLNACSQANKTHPLWDIEKDGIVCAVAKATLGRVVVTCWESNSPHFCVGLCLLCARHHWNRLTHNGTLLKT